MKKNLSIGEMANLSKLTVQRLRHYSNIGLVAPVKIDPQTNYRYYSYEQLELLSLIQGLQYIGLSLAEIKDILDNHDPVFFPKKLQSVIAEIQEEEAHLFRKKNILNLFLKSHSQMASVKNQGGFHVLTYTPTTCQIDFDHSEQWEKAQEYFKQELAKRHISKSHIYFCGIKKYIEAGHTFFAYFMGLHYPKETLALEWIIYSDYEEQILDDVKMKQALIEMPQCFILPLPHLNNEAKKYSVLKPLS